MSKTLRYRLYLGLILLLTCGLKLWFTATTSLSLFSEETQYWLWSKNLDWNYYSKPLMIAVYNFISTALLGDTEIGVRINAVFFTAATAWVVFEFALLLFKNQRVALWAAVMLLVMPFFHLASFFHTTDSSLLFYWTITLYFGWRAMEEDRLKWWIWAGVTTALGMLSKNIMILIGPIFFLHLLIFRPKKLLQKDFYLYAGVAALSLIPILIWNFQNDFVTFRHVGTLGGVEGEKQPFLLSNSIKYLGEYVGGQLAIISAFFLPFLWLGFRKLLRSRDEKLAFLLLPAVLVWLLFFGIAIFKRVEVNWPAFAYVSLPILMAWILYPKSAGWKGYRVFATAISGVLLVLVMLPQPLDMIGFKKIFKPKNDPLARLAGFREAGEALGKLVDDWELDRHFIFSESYHLSSEMAFYTRDNPQTYCINLGRRKNQFDLWPGISQFESQDFYGIYVTLLPETDDRVLAGFDEVVDEERVYGVYRGDTVRTIRIQVLRNLRGIEEVETNQY